MSQIMKNKIKLLILDVDGVMSDGKKYYDNTGFAVYKTFCDKDFTAIKKFRASGCKVIFLSGDKNVNESVANNRNIDFYNSRGKCKTEFIDKILETYNVSINEVAFVGDDIFDIPLMKMVGYKYCPNDAVKELKKICSILDNNGGNNCINELYDKLRSLNAINPYKLNILLDIDNNDKF